MKTSEFIEDVDAPSKSESNGEVKAYDPRTRVLYLGQDDKAKIAFLKWDYDLSPENEKGKPNPNLDIIFTHNLPTAVRGRWKAQGLRRLIRFKAKEDAVDKKTGEIYLRKGQMSAYYDKLVADQDILSISHDKSKANGGRDFRKSIELLVPVYVFELEKKDKDGVMQKFEVNDVVIASFNMQDIFYPAKSGFGKVLQAYYNDADGNMLESHKFDWTPISLNAKKELNKSEKAIIEPLRADIENILESKKDLLPLTYAEFEDAYNKGEVKMNVINPEAVSSSVSKTITTKVSNEKAEQIMAQYGAKLEDDEIPF